MSKISINKLTLFMLFMPVVFGSILITMGLILESVQLLIVGVFVGFLCFFGIKNVIKTYVDAKEEEREARIQALQQKQRSEQMARDLEMAKNLLTAGQYESAAKIYEKWGMWEKAGEMRKIEKSTSLSSSSPSNENQGISIHCHNCGAPLPSSKPGDEITCIFCGEKQIVPMNSLR